VSELTTSLSRDAALEFDPVADHIAAALVSLPGWCLDIINTWSVVLGIAPITSGLVSFLCLVSIGRACRLRGCAYNANGGSSGVADGGGAGGGGAGDGSGGAGSCCSAGAAGPDTQYCSATGFFTWTLVSLGLVVALVLTFFAWLRTGLFSVDVAIDLLANSSGALGSQISTALAGYTVNVTALGIDLFAGSSLAELAGVQVVVEDDLTAWRVFAFLALLFCFLAFVAVCAMQKKMRMVRRPAGTRRGWGAGGNTFLV
jgi:hypothetical protein